MFGKKNEDPMKAKLKKEIDKHAVKVQAEYERRQADSKKLLDKEYVQKQLGIQKVEDAKLKAKQDAIIQKSMNKIKKTELHAFQCLYCKAWVDMQNLTCPNCGQLYCQWCGAAMDMENPGLCPRCQRGPMYEEAALVVTRVEDLPPEERFWEQLPTCPKCGGTVQPDWTECPICNSKLSPSKAAPAGDGPADTGEFPEEVPPEAEAMAPGDQPPEEDKKKKGKRTGI